MPDKYHNDMVSQIIKHNNGAPEKIVRDLHFEPGQAGVRASTQTEGRLKKHITHYIIIILTAFTLFENVLPAYGVENGKEMVVHSEGKDPIVLTITPTEETKGEDRLSFKILSVDTSIKDKKIPEETTKNSNVSTTHKLTATPGAEDKFMSEDLTPDAAAKPVAAAPAPEIKTAGESKAAVPLKSDSASAKGYEIQAMPGSSWGQITHDNDGLTGSGFMGNINQGVQWLTLPWDVKFITFAEYRYRTRAHNKTYYDTQGPAIGIEFRKSIFSFGMDYYWEHFPGLNTTSKNREFYLTWFYDWDLKPEGKNLFFGIKGLPGSNWTSITYDINGLNGSGAQGFINQGVDWFVLPGDVIFNTFAEFRFKVRTKNKQYYDTNGAAIGIDLRKSPFHLGVNYYWERLPELSQTSNRVQFYLTWFHTWDLKKYFKP